jgi:hypothetical protein
MIFHVFRIVSHKQTTLLDLESKLSFLANVLHDIKNSNQIIYKTNDSDKLKRPPHLTIFSISASLNLPF